MLEDISHTRAMMPSRRFLCLAVVPALLLAACARTPAKNPDPNHTHADFAVWIDGKQFDFSGEQYMSDSSTDASTHPEEGPKKYLHLHDGNGQVVHRHKPGMTFGEFLESLGFRIEQKGNADCLVTPDTERYCEEGQKYWRFRTWRLVDGKKEYLKQDIDSPQIRGISVHQLRSAWNFVFEDNDQLLLTYGDGNDQAYSQLTDDACLYSKTCPWRGEPPTENCIADPEVPCM